MLKATHYIAGLVYEENTLSFAATEEGRILPNGSKWEYEYNLKDHLGNNRVTFGINSAGTTELRQTSHYYPFGLLYNQKDYLEDTNYAQNKYLYNGKELQSDGFGDVSLDWYDYGARMYDPAIGRWHVIDPMAAESHNSLYSPYNYCINNPMRYIDPDGMDWFQNEKTGDVVYVANLHKGAEKGMEEGWQHMGANDMFNGDENKSSNGSDVILENSGLASSVSFDDKADWAVATSATFKGDNAKKFMGNQGLDFKPIEQVIFTDQYDIQFPSGTSYLQGTEERINLKSKYMATGSVENGTTAISKILSAEISELGRHARNGYYGNMNRKENVARYRIDYTNNKFDKAVLKYGPYFSRSHNAKVPKIYPSIGAYQGGNKLIDKFLRLNGKTNYFYYHHISCHIILLSE